MNKIIIFIALVFASQLLYAQKKGQAVIDSLLGELPKQKEDTNKVILLYRMSYGYKNVNPDEGIKYGGQSLELATQLHYEQGIASGNYVIGLNYTNKSDYPKASDYVQKALNKFEETGDKKGIANAIGTFGTIYNSQGNYSKALEYYFKQMKIDEEIGDKKGIASATANIGLTYTSESDYPKALEYDFKALKMKEEIGYKIDIAIVTGNIGLVYIKQGDYPKALEYFLKNYEIDEESGDKVGIARISSNIAVIYSIQANFPKALEYNYIALKIDEEFGNKEGIASVSSNIGNVYGIQHNYPKALEYNLKTIKIYDELGDKGRMAASQSNVGKAYLDMFNDTTTKGKGTHPDKTAGTSELVNEKLIIIPMGKGALLHNAIKYLQLSVTNAKEVHDLDCMQDAYQLLSEAYKDNHDYKKSLDAYENYTAIKDSVFSTENNKKVLKTGMEGEYQRKRLTDSLVNMQAQKDAAVKLQKQKSYTYTGLAGILLLACFSFFIVKERGKSEKERKRSDGLVVQKEGLLLQKEELLQQKDMLMREIHHRVKNNLQVVGTLLDLQLANITDEHAKDAITESNTRLQAISLIHHQLYRDEHITTIECAQFATGLHTQISAVFSKPGQQNTLHNNIPVTILDIDTAVPLGLILNELMTNSYKYAFNAQGGSIACNIEKAGDGYKLTYKDSGPGLPAGLDIKKLKSLGMMMMKGLSKQIGGAFSYVPETKTFVITFKDAAEMKKAA